MPTEVNKEIEPEIAYVLSTPGQGALAENVPLTPALLRLDPMFDPLRNDPRFRSSAKQNQSDLVGRCFD
jgi:hypothetical protein